jgi:CheY-like chemotaxis protein
MASQTILLVDDDPVFVAAVSAVLSSRYELRTASSGEEGLAKIGEERPDLIILDVMMDYMSEGFDVARKLRTDPETKTIPLIMLTGVDRLYDYRLEQDESWVPCDRYLEKPVEPETLLAEVETLLESSRQ